MNPTVRCLVVDDEPLAIDIVQDYIERTPGLELVASTTNAIEGLQLVQDGKVDLVFLDVQMPEITGIQFLKIVNGKCDVILTTAYPDYAFDGFELNVVDYLLKPIAFDRFSRAVQKVLTSRPEEKQFEEALQTDESQNFFFVKTENRFQRVDLDDVLYIEGLKDYVSIYTDTERIITLQVMKKLEESLPSHRFARVHRSYIIALDKIRSIEKSRITVGDKVIPIGDTYRDIFYKLIGEHKG